MEPEVPTAEPIGGEQQQVTGLICLLFFQG